MQIIFPLIAGDSFDIVMTVLGILHPLHVLTSKACQQVAKNLDQKVIYFADFPYVSRKSGEKIIKDSGLEPFEIYDGGLRNEKIIMFEKCYPSERNILRWDRNSIMNHPEMIFFPEEIKT